MYQTFLLPNKVSLNFANFLVYVHQSVGVINAYNSFSARETLVMQDTQTDPYKQTGWLPTQEAIETNSTLLVQFFCIIWTEAITFHAPKGAEDHISEVLQH